MKRKIGLTAALVVALAMSGYAQKKPDFSGTWTMDQAATDAANPAPPAMTGAAPTTTGAAPTTTTTGAAPAMAGGGGGRMGGGRGMAGPLTIKQTADSLTIERQGRNGVQTTVYKLDGSEQDVAMGPMTAKVKAKWDGDKIVIEQTRPGQDGTPMTTTLTYSLDKDGGLWVVNGPRKTAYKKTT